MYDYYTTIIPTVLVMPTVLPIPWAHRKSDRLSVHWIVPCHPNHSGIIGLKDHDYFGSWG